MPDVKPPPGPLPLTALPPSDAAFAAAPAPPMGRLVLRGDAAVAAAAGAAFGVAIPARPLVAAESSTRAALWLGPDEWLLLAPAAELAGITRSLQAALAELPHSLVDVSHRQLGLALTGRLAARVLSSGCPLDLSPRAFPVGMAARTLFHKAEIVLWRQANGFHLDVWRSFAPYVAGHLAAARKGAEGLPEAALP